MSMRQISRIINLTYRVAAQTVPDCKIERDPLRRLYSVNYGLTIYVESLEKLDKLTETLIDAYKRRGIGGTLNGYRGVHGTWDLRVWPVTDSSDLKVQINRG